MTETPASAPPAKLPPPPPPPARELAALLSFMVPGTGQILQGLLKKDPSRLLKGVFFLVVLLSMFFVGMWLGKGKNVYIPHVQEGLRESNKQLRLSGREMPNLLADVYTRLQYAGQFWIGVAAWPALWNYYAPDSAILEQYYGSPGAMKKGEARSRSQLLQEGDQEASDLQFAPDMGKRWDIGWVYTVIAGVLNILVIYDAWAGPVPVRRELSATPIAPSSASSATPGGTA
jgi:uncharacterized protein DUF6677